MSDEDGVSPYQTRKRTSKEFRTVNRNLREAGEKYKTLKSKKDIPVKKRPTNEVTCKCRYGCRQLCEDRLKTRYFHLFYGIETHTNKTNYLLPLIDVIPVERRRLGSYDSPSSSRRQCTVTFFLPDNKGNYIRVCKKTFCETFCISGQVIETLVQRVKAGKTLFKDNRGGIRKQKYTQEDRELVQQHINSFPRDESHYTHNEDSQDETATEFEFLAIEYPFPGVFFIEIGDNKSK